MNDQPSSLAIKLAERFASDKPDAAKDIDKVITWHEWDERERIRTANKLLPGFCDNVRVFGNRDRNEFFELQLLPAESDLPYEVMFKRYAVPGRYWIYAFQWHRAAAGYGPRMMYCSEGGESLAKSLKMLKTDLNKPQVIDLFKRAFSASRIARRYRHDSLNLLEVLAPKSKVHRLVDKLCAEALEKRRAEIKAAKEGKQ